MSTQRIAVIFSAFAAAILLSQWLAQSPVRAHPTTQGFVEVVIYRERIVLRARVSTEEVVISNQMRVDNDDMYVLSQELYEKHAEYMLKHIHVSGDQTALSGKVLSVTPRTKEKKLSPLSVQAEAVIYEFEFPLNPEKLPVILNVKQDMLTEFLYAPGNPWEVTYVARIGHDEKEMEEGLLLTKASPILFPCDWSKPVAPSTTAKTAETPPARTVKVDRSGMFGSFLAHGVGHIIGHRTDKGWEGIGIDHLLFITALVLGAASLLDLVKVVTAFTIAHTLTLTLSVLDIVRLPERIVEPMIAASIVFVAIENIFWPQRSRGWGRLAAAFFFGLFHGLGFAGGLLDAMADMQGSTVLVAIVAFSIGVEVGHQVVVIPLYAILRTIRRAQKDEASQQRFSLLSLRYGSAVISVAGVFYLVTALGWVHPRGADEHPPEKPPSPTAH